jgi:hypothetical protein
MTILYRLIITFLKREGRKKNEYKILLIFFVNIILICVFPKSQKGKEKDVDYIVSGLLLTS